MALLFYDGFDHMGQPNSTMGKWQEAYYYHPAAGAGRTGTHGLQAQSYYSYSLTKPLPAVGGAIVGLALRTAGFRYGDVSLIEIREGGVPHTSICVNSAGRITMWRGKADAGGVLLATGQITLAINSWYYIEFKAIIDAVAGGYEVRVDMENDPGLVATGVNNRNGGTTGQWNNVCLRGITDGSGLSVDDFYVADRSGASPWNNFLGAVRVETLYPQTDAVAVGSNVGLTPSTGTDHGALVDEAAPTTTDWNGSAVVGAKDTYNYPPLTLGGTVFGVQTNMYAGKSDSSGRQVCNVLRVGGQDYDGPTRAISLTPNYICDVYQTKPAGAGGGIWLPADVATLQAGMKVVL